MTAQAATLRGILPVYLAFLVMGFGDLIGPLVSLVKTRLQLTQFEASFIAFAGFIMFGTLSIPTGIFQNRYGRKVTTIGGLLLVLAGLLVPLTGLATYAGYLVAVLLLGSGVTVLQVSAPPLLHLLSAAGKYTRNLTLGQFIKGIGTLSAPLIPILAYRYFDNRWEIVFAIFAAVTLVTLVVFSTRQTTLAESTRSTTASLSASLAVLRDTHTLKMVVGIFLYVGAEVSISATLPSYLEQRYGYKAADLGMAGTGLFFLSLMAGRFAGTVILTRITPQTFFTYSCLVSVAGLVLLAFGGGKVGFIAAIAIGAGFSNIFPLIFARAIEARPQKANELSALMVTAIAGGAIIPPATSFIADRLGGAVSLAVPLVCLLYLTVLAFARDKKDGLTA